MTINRSSIGQQIMKPPMKKKVVKKAKGGALSYLSPAYALAKGGPKNLIASFSPLDIAMGLDKEKRSEENYGNLKGYKKGGTLSKPSATGRKKGK